MRRVPSGVVRSAALALAVALVASTPLRAGDVARDFHNVIAHDAADPWVFRHADGRYYATMTTGRDVTIRRSATLSGVGGGEKKVIWKPPASGPDSRDIWAPELHRLRGKWYVYFAADDGANRNHRMFALENGADDPFEGAFVEKGKVFDPSSDRWAIDGTAIDLDGRLYFLWSGWEGDTDVAQRLYIAPMSDPWTISGPRVEISRPTLPWEGAGGPPSVNEGPQFLVRGRSVHVVYSAGGSWTDHYCLGLLTADRGADLLSPASWKKHPEPVFRGGNEIFGPGHCSFTTSPDGKEDWIVYHAARHRGSGWARAVRAQPFSWDEAGVPRFGTPAHPHATIPLPGGEPSRERFEAEAMDLGLAARVVRDDRASAGSKLVLDRAPGASAGFRVRVDEPGPCLVWVRYRHAPARPGLAARRLTVNGRAAEPVAYPPTGPDGWSCAVLRVGLIAGENRLRIDEGTSTLELDYVDVSPERRPAAAPR